MLRYLILYGFLACAWADLLLQTQNPASKGQVWPKPQYTKQKKTFYTFSPQEFQFSVINEKCEIVEKAVVRYKSVLKHLYEISRREKKNREKWTKEKQDIKYMFRRYRAGKLSNDNRENHEGEIGGISINLTEPCEKYPYLGMRESYTLSVSKTASLSSSSVWGILRGMETFSQLFYLADNFEEVRVNTTEITDYPEHPHRGLMLDTARHFISVENILKLLDAMAMNKMNVFHWHLVDDESFSYQSQRLPELSELGSYHYSMVYSQQDIRYIIEYAKERGIRIVPEINIPGHTKSWAIAYPNALTNCGAPKDDLSVDIPNTGPLNPARNSTYKLIRTLLREVQELFPDKYFHIGGSDIDLKCWETNPTVKYYMKMHNITSAKNLLGTFFYNVLEELHDNTSPIFWQDVVDHGLALPNRALLQLHRETSINDTIHILKMGQQVIISSSWILDNPTLDFESMYISDPRETIKVLMSDDKLDHHIYNLIQGGEACLYSELVNDYNVIPKVWPRTSAVAEALWTSSAVRGETDDSDPLPGKKPYSKRIEEQVCRMMRRGITVEPPTGPDFCLL